MFPLKFPSNYSPPSTQIPQQELLTSLQGHHVHDDQFQGIYDPDNRDHVVGNARQQLYTSWARFGVWYNEQPLCHVR